MHRNLLTLDYSQEPASTVPPPSNRHRKHPYNRSFTPPKRDAARYLLDRIPGPLWRRVRVMADREGTSLRGLILQLLTDWVERKEHR